MPSYLDMLALFASKLPADIDTDNLRLAGGEKFAYVGTLLVGLAINLQASGVSIYFYFYPVAWYRSLTNCTFAYSTGIAALLDTLLITFSPRGSTYSLDSFIGLLNLITFAVAIEAFEVFDSFGLKEALFFSNFDNVLLIKGPLLLVIFYFTLTIFISFKDLLGLLW
jgi:hypothetical protein